MSRLTCLLFAVVYVGAVAAPLKFSSGANRTHLLELYSSEGCSSCPPAEAWLGNLRDEPGLWRDFVPVAFHVIYWDRLGWADRFASRDLTARQYAYASRWSSDSVYTPGFVLDGAEWRGSSGLRLPPASVEKSGVLTVEYADSGACRVRYDAPGDHEVQVALLGGGIVSRVHGGENKGRTLRHEFVALALKTARLEAGAAQVLLPAAARDGVTRTALAVWVTRRGDLTPLQATGGWLD